MVKGGDSSRKSGDLDSSMARLGQQRGDTPLARKYQPLPSPSSSISLLPEGQYSGLAGPGLDHIPEVAQEEDATIGAVAVAGSVGGYRDSESVAPAPTEPPVDAWLPAEAARRGCSGSENSERWAMLPQIDSAVTTAATSDQNPPQQQVQESAAAGAAEPASA
jgi:hypothetical protein